MCQHLDEKSWCYTTAPMCHIHKEPLFLAAWKHMTHCYDGRQLWEQLKPGDSVHVSRVMASSALSFPHYCLCLHPGATPSGSRGLGWLTRHWHHGTWMKKKKKSHTTAFVGYVCSCAFLDFMILHLEDQGCISGVKVWVSNWKGPLGEFLVP